MHLPKDSKQKSYASVNIQNVQNLASPSMYLFKQIEMG